MRYLLDTHVLLWLVGDPDQIPARVHETLSDPSHDLYASAISTMEVATKTRLGRLHAVGLVENWSGRISDIGALELDARSDHLLLAGSMPWSHRDPFDRALVAQATIEAMTLVTVDRAMEGLPAPRMLTW